MLSLMTHQGSLVSLGNGMYSLPTELLSGGPLHSFEIALKLAKKGAISHRSAFSYYGLSDQMLSRVYVTVPREKGANLSTTREYTLKGVRYSFIRVLPENYWGIKPAFLGESRILITDLEKTLIDGLLRPEYCGGFREVIYTFEKGISKALPETLLSYAKKTSLVTCKRLGWVLDQIGKHAVIQEHLVALSMPYYQKLDPAGSRRGKYNHRWNLMENI